MMADLLRVGELERLGIPSAVASLPIIQDASTAALQHVAGVWRLRTVQHFNLLKTLPDPNTIDIMPAVYIHLGMEPPTDLPPLDFASIAGSHGNIRTNRTPDAIASTIRLVGCEVTPNNIYCASASDAPGVLAPLSKAVKDSLWWSHIPSLNDYLDQSQILDDDPNGTVACLNLYFEKTTNFHHFYRGEWTDAHLRAVCANPEDPWGRLRVYMDRTANVLFLIGNPLPLILMPDQLEKKHLLVVERDWTSKIIPLMQRSPWFHECAIRVLSLSDPLCDRAHVMKIKDLVAKAMRAAGYKAPRYRA